MAPYPAVRLLLVLLSVFALPATLSAAESDPVRKAYEERLARSTGNDAALVSLAIWCRQNELETEATTHLESALELNPDNPRARQLLGYERIKGQWIRGPELYKAKGLVEHRGRWITPQQRTKLIVRQNKIREMARERSDWANAWELKTKNFIFTSNCPPAQVQEMARSLESCYEQLSRIFKPAKHDPIPVEVCATQEQFIQYSFSKGIPMGPGTLGYFYWRPAFGRQKAEMGIRCFWAGSMERTLGTLFHECTHLAIRNAYDDVPIWSNEGMAVFFEFARITDKGLDIQSIPFDRLWHLHDQLKEDEVSLSELVTMPQIGFSAEYYAQGWGLIHYLLYADKGKLRRNLDGFYRIKPRQGDLTDFRTAFGKAPQEMFADYKAYIESLKPESVDDLMAAAIAALEYRGDFDRAIAYADEAIAKDGTAWQPMACKARVLLNHARLRNDPEIAQQALDLYTAALAKRPAPRGRAKFGLRDLTHDYHQGLAAIWAGDQERALAIADSILDHDDLNADAYRLTALAFIAAPQALRNLDEAKDALDFAADLGRGHETDYVRARLLLAQGDKSKAAKLLSEAAEQDGYGFGGHFYQRESRRLIGAPALPPGTRVIIIK